MTDKETEHEDTRAVEETSAVGGVLEGSFDPTPGREDASPVEEEIEREKDAAREEDEAS